MLQFLTVKLCLASIAPVLEPPSQAAPQIIGGASSFLLLTKIVGSSPTITVGLRVAGLLTSG